MIEKFDTKKALSRLPDALTHICDRLLTPAGCQITGLTREPESAKYDALQLQCDDKRIVFRKAKTTPTKLGHFVTLWKRATPQSEIAPFDQSDSIDFFMIAVSDTDHRGLFMLSSSMLIRENIVSLGRKDGKRAIRVYAPWVKTIAPQAIRTQKWQAQSFIDLENEDLAIEKFKTIFK